MTNATRARILILSPQKPGEGFGGAEQHLATLAQILDPLCAGIEFISIGDAPPPSWVERALLGVIPLLRSPLAVKRLLRHRALPPYDVIFSVELMGVGLPRRRHLHLFFGSYSGFHALALSPPRGLKRLLRRANGVLANTLERHTARPSGAVANSIGLQECLRQHGIPVRDEVIPPPTDTEKFQPGDKTLARQMLGLPLDKKLLLFAGRWEYAKGADRIEALANTLAPNWHILIAAPGNASWPWPNSPAVTVLKDIPNDQMVTVYQSADVTLQPSRFEGYSLVASEAQSCGCPVITSDVGQAKHFLLSSDPHIKESVIAQPDSPAEWAQRIDALLVELPQASVASRSYALEHVSPAVIQHQWMQLLTRLYPEFEWHPR
ncbi:glycosyltransferase family 4 protein [Aquabacterium sp.]|uniref:glycosyltransferase family 4 protein n=1 Tax=Aquabacterium sp. TaxID=1872578 RepID=UPI0035AF75E0